MEQLRIAENLLAFLASLSLSVLQKQDYAEAGIDFRKLWDTGVAFGTWKLVIQKSAEIFRSYKGHALASAIAGLDIAYEKKGFGADVAALITARNNFHHGREAAGEAAIISASEDTQERLQRCMEALAFLIEFPIYQVQDLDVNREGTAFNLRCLMYRGDHPGLKQRDINLPRPLKKNDLYMDLGLGDWMPLYPFLNVETCPHCKAREVYFIEGWSRSKRFAQMKSFERGHSETSGEVFQTLEQL